MKHTLFGVDASLLLGSLGCAAAALASAAVVLRRQPAPHSPWRAVAVAQCVFTIELLAGLRYRWHDAADALMRSHDWYNGRGPLQVALLSAVAVVLAAAAAFACWRLQADGAGACAATATAAMAGLLLVEAVSKHDIDTLMYAPAGPVVQVAWAWVAVSTAVVVSAFVALRRAMR